MTRSQLNLRVREQLECAIDKKRIELRASLGSIPSRSELLRLALSAYLGVSPEDTEVDLRSTSGTARRRVR